LGQRGIYRLGATSEEIGGSEYLKVVHGRVDGKPRGWTSRRRPRSRICSGGHRLRHARAGVFEGIVPQLTRLPPTSAPSSPRRAPF